MMSVRENLGWPFLTTNTNYTFPPAPPPIWDRDKQKSSWAIFGISTGADSAGE